VPCRSSEAAARRWPPEPLEDSVHVPPLRPVPVYVRLGAVISTLAGGPSSSRTSEAMLTDVRAEDDHVAEVREPVDER
jgi:hypothetical protein